MRGLSLLLAGCSVFLSPWGKPAGEEYCLEAAETQEVRRDLGDFSPMGKLSLDNAAEAAGALPGPSAITAIVTPT